MKKERYMGGMSERKNKKEERRISVEIERAKQTGG